MAQIAVIGESEFTMGFSLIGIQRVVEAEKPEEIKDAFTKLMNPEIGVIVTSDKTVEKLEANFRRNVENSITPIVVILSESSVAQENLRDMIKKAIGIDVLK